MLDAMFADADSGGIGMTIQHNMYNSIRNSDNDIVVMLIVTMIRIWPRDQKTQLVGAFIT